MEKDIILIKKDMFGVDKWLEGKLEDIRDHHDRF